MVNVHFLHVDLFRAHGYNKNVDIKFSGQDTFLEYPSSGTILFNNAIFFKLHWSIHLNKIYVVHHLPNS